MKLNTVDLEKKLQKLKVKEQKKSLIDEVKTILGKASHQDREVLKNLAEPSQNLINNSDLLDTSHIYSLEQIKQICIKYRLRFLDSSVFKGEIPYEAIAKIKQLERVLDQPLKNFKIVAPKELFRLEDKDSDPLLFLKLGNDRFYLIHKWGGELNWFRSFLAYPLRGLMNMFWFLAVVALIFSLIIPTPSWDVFAFLLVHTFIAICGMTCLIVFSLRENFSSAEWDSKYFS